jgi:hypothetical protein
LTRTSSLPQNIIICLEYYRFTVGLCARDCSQIHHGPKLELAKRVCDKSVHGANANRKAVLRSACGDLVTKSLRDFASGVLRCETPHLDYVHLRQAGGASRARGCKSCGCASGGAGPPQAAIGRNEGPPTAALHCVGTPAKPGFLRLQPQKMRPYEIFAANPLICNGHPARLTSHGTGVNTQ